MRFAKIPAIFFNIGRSRLCRNSQVHIW